MLNQLGERADAGTRCSPEKKLSTTYRQIL
jgi:hypothetical protein